MMRESALYSRRSGSAVMPVACSKYSSSVPSKQSKTVKWDLSGILAHARAAAEHLLEEDAGLHRAQEDDVLQGRDIHAGREHVHGHHDRRVRPVAELADALQRAVHAAGDLLDEGVAPAEDVAGNVDQLVGVGGVRQVVDGEDERLRESGRSRCSCSSGVVLRSPPVSSGWSRAR